MRGYDSVISFCTIITTAERKQCPDGGMVDTLVLEASAERRESSSLSWGTILKHSKLDAGSVKYALGLIPKKVWRTRVFQYGDIAQR